VAGAHPRRGTDAHVPHRGDSARSRQSETILGQLRQQLLSPAPDEQDGYVTNVFYSCDALVHAETMVLTYGIGDAAIGVATVSLPELLDALSPSPTRPRL
jgi:predicted GH43/DUF377 family glycosyl hydrolase